MDSPHYSFAGTEDAKFYARPPSAAASEVSSFLGKAPKGSCLCGASFGFIFYSSSALYTK